MSNSKVTLSGTNIRPSDFGVNDICQNLIDTSSNAIVMKIDNSQLPQTLDISGYSIDISGTNGSNATKQTIIKRLTDVSCVAINNDVSLNDLSANTTYDLSINLFNVNDMSNSKLGISGTTRPSDFTNIDLSQNVSDSSANAIIININNSQISGTLDISGYEIDISGDNSFTTSKKTVIKTAVNKNPDGLNTDVSLNDLSANTLFDLSINLIGSILDLSNSKIALQTATAPTPFTVSDVTQNKDSDYSNNQVILTVQHKDLTGTLDMSAITILFKGTIGTGGISDVSPSDVDYVNVSDLTTYNGQYNSPYELAKSIDDDLVTYSYTSIGGHTNKATSLEFPAQYVGKNLTGLEIKWKDYGGYNPNIKFGYGRSGSANSLNMTAATSDGNIGSVNTGTVTTLETAGDPHLKTLAGKTNSGTMTTTTVTFQDHTIVNGDTLLLALGSGNGAALTHFQVYEYTMKIKLSTIHTDTINKKPTNVGPTQSNSDISLNDLSGNMKYDLSVNLLNTQEIDGDKIGLTVYTRPDEITNANVSQNMGDTSTNTITFNWKKRTIRRNS